MNMGENKKLINYAVIFHRDSEYEKIDSDIFGIVISISGIDLIITTIVSNLLKEVISYTDDIDTYEDLCCVLNRKPYNDSCIFEHVKYVCPETKKWRDYKINYKKIQNNRVPYDIYGLRIIYNDSNNYHNYDFAYTIKNILISNFNTLDYLYDDYIANPKINNYQSLHVYVLTNILLEIQIRNSFMHSVAINGSASNYY